MTLILFGSGLLLCFALASLRHWRKKCEHLRAHPPCPWCDADGESEHKYGCIASKYDAKGRPKEVQVKFEKQCELRFNFAEPFAPKIYEALVAAYNRLYRLQKPDGQPMYDLAAIDKQILRAIEDIAHPILYGYWETSPYPVRVDEQSADRLISKFLEKELKPYKDWIVLEQDFKATPMWSHVEKSVIIDARYRLVQQSFRSRCHHGAIGHECADCLNPPPKFKPGQFVRHINTGELLKIIRLDDLPYGGWVVENASGGRGTFDSYKIEPALPRKGEHWIVRLYGMAWQAYFPTEDLTAPLKSTDGQLFECVPVNFGKGE